MPGNGHKNFIPRQLHELIGGIGLEWIAVIGERNF